MGTRAQEAEKRRTYCKACWNNHHELCKRGECGCRNPKHGRAKDVEPVGAKKYVCITKDGKRHDIEAENARIANFIAEKRFGYANISVPPQESLRAKDVKYIPAPAEPTTSSQVAKLAKEAALRQIRAGERMKTKDLKPVSITGKGANVAPMAKLIPRSKRPKAEDANPFERDTDAGAERIVRREAKAGLSAERIAKKYGFSLSFVKEVLGDVKPVGDAFKTIPKGTKVTWHYRSAIGHGTVTGVHKMGTTAANTTYSVHEEDHHPGEPSTVYHSGAALTRA